MSKFQYPKCGKWENRILDTRAQSLKVSIDWIAVVWRIRKCQSCTHQWETIEMNETDKQTWIPPNGEYPVDCDGM